MRWIRGAATSCPETISAREARRGVGSIDESGRARDPTPVGGTNPEQTGYEPRHETPQHERPAQSVRAGTASRATHERPREKADGLRAAAADAGVDLDVRRLDVPTRRHRPPASTRSWRPTDGSTPWSTTPAPRTSARSGAGRPRRPRCAGPHQYPGRLTTSGSRHALREHRARLRAELQGEADQRRHRRTCVGRRRPDRGTAGR
jgi:hypothetical protein